MNNPEKVVQTSTSNRMGEKIGWIGGWTGGFCWVFAIAIVWFVRGAILEGVLGVAIFIVAEILVVIFAPWRHPETRYYLLMLPIYILFLASVGWAIWSFGGIGQSGLHSWNLLWIFPCLSPMITIGWRRWVDFQPPAE